MMKSLSSALILAYSIAVSPLAAQTEPIPDPDCNILTVIFLTQQHLRCDPEDAVMRSQLTASLQMYSKFYQRNAGVSARFMADAINGRISGPPYVGFDCRKGAIADSYAAHKADPEKLARTTRLHVRNNVPWDADFERGCWGDIEE